MLTLSQCKNLLKLYNQHKTNIILNTPDDKKFIITYLAKKEKYDDFFSLVQKDYTLLQFINQCPQNILSNILTHLPSKIITPYNKTELINILDTFPSLTKPIDSQFILNLNEPRFIKKFNVQIGIEQLLELGIDYLPYFSHRYLHDYYLHEIKSKYNIKFTSQEKEQIILYLISNNYTDLMPYFQLLDITSNEITNEILNALSQCFLQTKDNIKRQNLILTLGKLYRTYGKCILLNTQITCCVVLADPDYVDLLNYDQMEYFMTIAKPSEIVYLLNHPNITQYPHILSKVFKIYINLKKLPTTKEFIYIPDDIIASLTIKQIKSLLTKSCTYNTIVFNTSLIKSKLLSLIAQNNNNISLLDNLKYFDINNGKVLLCKLLNINIYKLFNMDFTTFNQIITNLSTIKNEKIRVSIITAFLHIYLVHSKELAFKFLEKHSDQLLEYIIQHNKKRRNKKYEISIK